MEEILATLFPCLTNRHTSHPTSPAEKASLMSFEPANPQDLATSILNMLESAEKLSPGLDTTVHNIITDNRPISAKSSWWQSKFAETVLDGLVRLVNEVKEKGTQLSGAMAEAFTEASAAAEAFVKGHPVATTMIVTMIVTVIALFILAVLTPFILEALGFGAEGVLEGE